MKWSDVLGVVQAPRLTPCGKRPVYDADLLGGWAVSMSWPTRKSREGFPDDFYVGIEDPTGTRVDLDYRMMATDYDARRTRSRPESDDFFMAVRSVLVDGEDPLVVAQRLNVPGATFGLPLHVYLASLQVIAAQEEVNYPPSAGALGKRKPITYLGALYLGAPLPDVLAALGARAAITRKWLRERELHPGDRALLERLCL